MADDSDLFRGALTADGTVAVAIAIAALSASVIGVIIALFSLLSHDVRVTRERNTVKLLNRLDSIQD